MTVETSFSSESAISGFNERVGLACRSFEANLNGERFLSLADTFIDGNNEEGTVCEQARCANKIYRVR